MAADVYILDNPAGEARLLAALAAAFDLTTTTARPQWRTYLDSFDWRLHRAGLVCVHVAGTCRLEPLAGGRARAVAAGHDTLPPRWPHDLPPGRLRDRLAETLEMRALIPLVTLRADTQVIRLRGRRDSRVLGRLEVTAWRLEKQRPVTVWRTVALQVSGRDTRVANRLRRAAKAAGLTLADRSPLDWALAIRGLVPRAYSAKIDVALAPAMTAREAAQAIGRHLLQTMRRNEAGLRADIDTEFLHDFRVAVRRTRAALGELRGVWPPRVTQEFKTGFRDLGRLTGPVRDLDVYLLAEAEIRGQVPANLQGGLDPLFATLRAQRADAIGELQVALASPRHRRFLRRWAIILDPPDGRQLAASPASGEPVLAYASASIHRRWRRLIARGLAITDDATAADLHALRIHGKKLRYLLEFFAPLYPSRGLGGLVRRLKVLQDNLGEHNDLVVQGEYLRGVLAKPVTLEEAAAIEALLDGLAARQRQVRQAFAETFGAFASAEVSAQFEQLFGPTAPA